MPRQRDLDEAASQAVAQDRAFWANHFHKQAKGWVKEAIRELVKEEAETLLRRVLKARWIHALLGALFLLGLLGYWLKERL